MNAEHLPQWTDLDSAFFLIAVDREIAQHPGSAVSVVSPSHGAVCGVVPACWDGRSRVVLRVSPDYFDPYSSGAQAIAAASLRRQRECRA